MTDETPEKRYCARCLTAFEADPAQCPNLSCRRKRPRDGWGRIFRHGEVFDRNYRIHKMLAVGGAGVTYVARELGPAGDEVGPKLAVKVLLAARDQGPYVRRLATEAQIIQELDHPNIVQYLGFVHRAGHSPYLITRFESGGSLLDHMRRVGTLSVRSACVVGRQICWALEKAHERGIVHRDLKPENVLLARPVDAEEDPVVRVADFGIAKVQGSLGSGITRVGAFVGTPHYAAPEQFVGGAVSEAADVYSVSALLYFTMMARHVVRFADRLDPEDSFQLLSDNLPARVVRDQDPMADVDRINKVLSVSMQVDPGRRCTVTQLDAMLEAILNGTDPAVPAADRSLPTGDFDMDGASVMGVAGAMEGREDGAPAPGDADPTDAVEPRDAGGGALAAAGAVAAGAAMAGLAAAAVLSSRKEAEGRPKAPETLPPDSIPHGEDANTQRTLEPAEDTLAEHSQADAPAPAPAPAAATAPAPAPAPDADSGGMGGIVAAVLMVGLVLIATAAGGGWYLAEHPGVLDAAKEQLGLGGDAAARTVTAGSSDATDRADYKAIAASARGARDKLAVRCGVEAGAKVSLDLEVGPAGEVASAAPVGASSQGSCVADQLQGMRLDRVGKGAVRARITLAW